MDLPVRIRKATHGAISWFWRYEWPMVGILALGALILGFVGFKRADGSLSVWDALYRDLQLPVLEGGALVKDREFRGNSKWRASWCHSWQRTWG